MLKEFNYHIISSCFVFMPFFLSFLLSLSKHPKILAADFSTPFKWEFYVGKKVTIADSHDYDGKQGIVQTVKPQYIEVELTGGEGLVSVAWKEVQKCYSVGNFVQVSHGPCQGHLGWVVDVYNDEINCIKELPQKLEHEGPEFASQLGVSSISSVKLRIYILTYILNSNSLFTLIVSG